MSSAVAPRSRLSLALISRWMESKKSLSLSYSSACFSRGISRDVCSTAAASVVWKLLLHRLRREEFPDLDTAAAVTAVEEGEDPYAFGESVELLEQLVVDVLPVVQHQGLVETVGLVLGPAMERLLPAGRADAWRRSGPVEASPLREANRPFGGCAGPGRPYE